MKRPVWLAICAAIALATPLAIGVARADDAQVAAGAAYFKRTCGVCHMLDPAKKGIGPSLIGVVGRPSASVPGFAYSEAMKKANVTWTPETLAKYLPDPKAMVPGTKMIFVGVKKPEDVEAVIAFLTTLK